MSYKSGANEKSVSADNRILSSSDPNEYEYRSIPLDNIIPDVNQPRKDFSGLEGLINSIKYEGLIYPITIAPQPDNPDRYIIIDGERRFRAYKELNEREINSGGNSSKYGTIRARILPTFEQRVGILLNLMNKNYNSIEIAEGLDLLLKEITSKDKSFKQKELAEYLGKSPTNVSEYFSLLKLPSEIKLQEREDPCVPFNKLKQLAASKITNEDKINEYNELRSEYESKADDSKSSLKNSSKEKSSTNQKHFQATDRHYNALTKKLDGTSTALGKFEIKDISDDQKGELRTKLDKIIEDAEKLKRDLETKTTPESPD